jgi:DNA (cytosine-5)-methyltransferase 1
MFKLLDLFCCEGLGADGYSAAGFDITGVDIQAQKRYPYTFVQDHWLNYLVDHGHLYDAVHASPPCQAYSRMKHFSRPTEKVIDDVYNHLVSSGKPFIIENVPGAPLPDRFRLHGKMFGLSCIKERWFCSNIFIPVPEYSRQYLSSGDINILGRKYVKSAVKKKAMNIPADRRVSEHGLNQGLPPAYTRYIGEYLIHHLETIKK